MGDMGFLHLVRTRMTKFQKKNEYSWSNIYIYIFDKTVADCKRLQK